MARMRYQLIGFAVVLALALTACADVRATSPTRTRQIVVRVDRGGFHWSDAGVGAVAGVGLSLSACGCLALVRLRRTEAISQTKGEQR